MKPTYLFRETNAPFSKKPRPLFKSSLLLSSKSFRAFSKKLYCFLQKPLVLFQETFSAFSRNLYCFFKRPLYLPFFSLILALFLPLNRAEAQEKKLSECIEYAKQHSPMLINLQNRIDAIEIELKDSKMAFTPNLGGSVGESLSFGRSQDKSGVFKDVSSGNTSFSIGAGLSLFEGGAQWYHYKKSKLAHEQTPFIIREAEDRVALKIVEGYINLLLAKEIVQVAEERLALTMKNLNETEARVKAGKLPESKLMELQTQAGSDKLSVAETKADAERAKANLLFDMGAGKDPNIDIATTSAEEILGRLLLSDAETKNFNWVSPTIALAQGEVDKAEYDIKRAKAALWPSLSMNAGYSNGYYFSLDKNLKGVNIPFADQMKSNGRTYIGLSLNIPIFSKGQIRSGIKRATLQKRQMENDLKIKQAEEEQNISLAKIDLNKSIEQHKQAKSNEEYAKESLRLAGLEFDAGRISSYEWEIVKNKYAEAKATHIRAIYNRLMRTITLKYFNTGVIDLSLAE
ncbi:TolC family protein [Porphyromonas sp. COT-108 OH2963]|uniref:TolC family protein n=1 Tax=Porphyromonas sp. COT-108 OH2963 TaxID=1515614 RepID=UPI00068A1964|nr:TolC family protein [Porphyromonas sp. COT-108 OH2963]